MAIAGITRLETLCMQEIFWPLGTLRVFNSVVFADLH